MKFRDKSAKWHILMPFAFLIFNLIAGCARSTQLSGSGRSPLASGQPSESAAQVSAVVQYLSNNGLAGQIEYADCSSSPQPQEISFQNGQLILAQGSIPQGSSESALTACQQFNFSQVNSVAYSLVVQGNQLCTPVGPSGGSQCLTLSTDDLGFQWNSITFAPQSGF